MSRWAWETEAGGVPGCSEEQFFDMGNAMQRCKSQGSCLRKDTGNTRDANWFRLAQTK